MPDITAIAAAINGLKTATDIVRYLRDTETAFKTADLKLRIAELTDALATAKLSLADVQDVLLAKDAEIKHLKESLKQKAEVIRHRDAYYEKNEKGQPVGDPYCSYCFENKNWSILTRTQKIEAKVFVRVAATCFTGSVARSRTPEAL